MYLFKLFYQPLFELNTFITGCSQECFHMYFVDIIVTCTLFTLIGTIIGHILIKQKKMLYKK